MRSKIETNEAGMSDLSEAMERVDAGDVIGARQAGAPAPSRYHIVTAETAPIHPDVAMMAERAIGTEAAKSALLLAEARANALTAVALAMVRVGQDPTAWRPADATAAWNIAEMLVGVQAAAKIELSPVFCQRSAEADIAKGAAVAKVLGGQD